MKKILILLLIDSLLWFNVSMEIGEAMNPVKWIFYSPYRQPITIVTVLAQKDESEIPLVNQNEWRVNTIKRIAKEYGIDWKIIAAICKKESRCDSSRIGDNGRSIGAYQINRPAHPDVTIENAKDFEWSTDFTANRLKKNEWMGEDEMIRSHNGLYADHRNDNYVSDVKSIMKSL